MMTLTTARLRLRAPGDADALAFAAHRALAWLRTDTRVDRVVSLIHPDNSRSIRVASKLGQTRLASREVAGVVHHEYGLVLTR